MSILHILMYKVDCEYANKDAIFCGVVQLYYKIRIYHECNIYHECKKFVAQRKSQVSIAPKGLRTTFKKAKVQTPSRGLK